MLISRVSKVVRKMVFYFKAKDRSDSDPFAIKPL